MSKSCTILAHVRNSKGEIVESRLFNDLLHYTSNNRELAKEYYAVGTNEEFLSRVRESEDFKTDENGEITFKSLRTLSKMDLETDKVLQVLNEDIRQGEYPYEEAVRKIQNFNENNSWADKMLATMVFSGDNKYFVSVVPKVKQTTDSTGKTSTENRAATEQKKLFDTVKNKELEKRLVALLESKGVSVKFIEGERKEGRYSTVDSASKLQDGLYGLIEVIHTGATSEVLAEEAGHFAVGALGDNPLVKRLESILEDPAVQREAVGEEEFNNSILGDNPKREVAGRLVGEALLRKLDNDASYKVLANRIANIAKRVFYRFTGNDIRWAAAKAEQIANRIAYQFVEGNNEFSVQNAISIEETMMHASDLSINQEVFRDVADEFGRMVRKLESIAQDNFSGKNQASLALSVLAATDPATGRTALQESSYYADSLAFNGIVQALVQINDYLGEGKEVDQLLNSVNFDNPSDFYANMAKYGRNLRQARVFLNSAEIILKKINIVLSDPNSSFKFPNGSVKNDVKYQDENGTWHSINLGKVLDDARRMVIAAVEGRGGVNGGPNKPGLITLEQTFFARFCEDIYGSKYVTSTVGKLWNNIWTDTTVEEYTHSIEDYVLGKNMDDIDILHRYLSSMSNNPDVIGQIVDKLVKTANKTADDIALRYQERLVVLKDRAEKLGLDVADLTERDDDGIPTGNLITPPASPTENGDREEDAIYEAYMADPNIGEPIAVHYGSWEKAREKHKKEHWEKFKNDNPGWESMSGFTRGYKWDQYYRKEFKDWNARNSVKVEVKDASGEVLYVKWIPNKKYESEQWFNLKAKYPPKNGETLERWLYDYRKLKEELDNMLPVGATDSYRLPQFRGTFTNSVRNTINQERGAFRGAKARVKTFWRRVILDSFVETSEDTDYGDLNSMNSADEELLGTKLDYEQERALRIPVFGIKKLDNMNDLSSDLFGSTLAYASMATSYSCLDNIVDALEVGTEALYNRKIQGKSNFIEQGLLKIGSKWKKPRGEHEVRALGAKNRAFCRYLKFLEKQVYGISASHWGIKIGTHRKFLFGKLIQNITALGGTAFLAGNVPGGAVNTLTGAFNIFKEAAVGDIMDLTDWRYAHKYYWSHFFDMWTPYLGEIGRLRKDSKLNLYLTLMNASGNTRSKFRNWYTTRSSLNNFVREAVYLPYSSGDHYMQAMSYLAVAHGTRLYNLTGEFSDNLWDAFETVDYTMDLDQKHLDMGDHKSLKFKRFCPLSSSQITSQVLREEGAYLKPVTKSTVDFEDWLVFQDANFADEVYKVNHPYEYNDYRDKYNALSEKQIMQFRASKYNILSSILQKTEDYLNSSSILIGVPSFSEEEQKYLNYRKVGTGDYNDILQIIKNDIYSIIWTKADESAYMNKCREVNNRLHGIYNEQDKTSWHQSWYTNAFLAMKGWALGYLEYMYSPNHYSVALGKDVEGYMNTYFKMVWNHVGSYKDNTFKEIVNRIIFPFTNTAKAGRAKNENALGMSDLIISTFFPWYEGSQKAMKKAGFSEEQNMNARRMAMSLYLMASLWVLRIATAPPDDDEDDDDEEELSPATGMVHYLAMRTLLEQEAFSYLPEIFIQSGSYLDFMPVGGAALFDVGKLIYEGIGAAVTDPDEKGNPFYYHQDHRSGKYEKGDSKFEQHFIRFIPYWKSLWALEHPYEAADSYEFGRKLRTK